MANTSNYTFNISLLDGMPPVLWQPGTMELTVVFDDSSTDVGTVTGSLSVPGWYSEPFPLAGKTVGSAEAALAVAVTGTTKEGEADLAVSLLEDGFLYSTTYLGGTASISDSAAHETYAYAITGYTGEPGTEPKQSRHSRAKAS